MSTAFALVDASIAESPFAFIAPVAFPKPFVGERKAHITKHPGLKSVGWIVTGHFTGTIPFLLNCIRRRTKVFA